MIKKNGLLGSAHFPLKKKPSSGTSKGVQLSKPDLGAFRMTRQRRVVFDALMSGRDHPTATAVFTQVQREIPTISLATVYNCLETLVQCGLVKQVSLDRSPSRYCANLEEHAHFFCLECGAVSDVPLNEVQDLARLVSVPEGSQLDKVDVTLKGRCSSCRQEDSE